MTMTAYQTLTRQFEEFDTRIRPDQKTLRAARDAHISVRGRISKSANIQNVHVADFLQGSYARHTMVKPPLNHRGEPEKVDVDIILVTNVPETVKPQQVLEQVKQWLEDEYGKDCAEIQSRSVKLTLPDVEVDLVPTSAPSEVRQEALKDYAEKALRMEADHNDVLDPNEVFGPQWDSGADAQWREEPLRIPDVDAASWQDTHPLAALNFTVQKNKVCDKKFLAIVRALKWWRRQSFLKAGRKHPKSYPIEHMVGDHCPHNFQSVAEGLTLTFERMRDAYATFVPDDKPVLRLRGLPDSTSDVIGRLEQDDFNAFYTDVERAAAIARNALECPNILDAVKLWQQLLGDEFKPPSLPSGGQKATGGYVAPAAVTVLPTGGRFG